MKKFKTLLILLTLTLVGCSQTPQKEFEPFEPYLRDAQIEVEKRISNAQDFLGSDEAQAFINEQKERLQTWGTQAKEFTQELKDKIQSQDAVNSTSALSDLEWTHEHIEYSQLDALNRVGSATAFLSKRNLGSSTNRESQTWKPTGWNNTKRTVNGKNVYPQNRGHLIAYTLSFNFDEQGNYVEGLRGSEDNVYNLFTQSSHSNQGEMQTYEEIVRDALKADKKVIYRVTPIFYENELMAREILIEILSTDGEINVTQLIANDHPDFIFDYTTGKSTLK